jgi:hypothetical protein
MASIPEVRQYLAHWFQLGKTIQINPGQEIRPQHVFQGTDYTAEFEDCWQQAITAKNCYLAGTDQTITELLSAQWDLVSCARCTMSIPLPAVGLPVDQTCPCNDLPNWPNSEVPMPRSPVDVTNKMDDLRRRLMVIDQS